MTSKPNSPYSGETVTLWLSRPTDLAKSSALRAPCSGGAGGAIVSGARQRWRDRGAVEHLKTLCCLGLQPESARIAVVPLLHEIIPHGWSGLALVAPDAPTTAAISKFRKRAALYRERLWRFADDPSALGSLLVPAFRAVAIGWALALQGRGYLVSRYHREIGASVTCPRLPRSRAKRDTGGRRSIRFAFA